jgi:hypothetical protein
MSIVMSLCISVTHKQLNAKNRVVLVVRAVVTTKMPRLTDVEFADMHFMNGFCD